MLLFGLLYESHNGVDHILVDDILYGGLSPIEGEEAHTLDGGIVLGLSACAIDDMRDLVES